MTFQHFSDARGRSSRRDERGGGTAHSAGENDDDDEHCHFRVQIRGYLHNDDVSSCFFSLLVLTTRSAEAARGQ